MTSLKKEDISIILKTQAVLTQISMGTKVFFNIAQYEKMGLTYSRKVWGANASGNKIVIGYKHYLTDKGKRINGAVV